MADVFISYSRKDKDFVRQLHDALVQLKREVWVDWEDIPLTAEWLHEIYAGIDSADNFIFVITPDSIGSATCHKEIAHAAENNKRLIPVVRRTVPDADVPDALAKLNFVYLRESDPFEATFAALISALDNDLEWKKTHSRLLVRGKEWEQKGRDRSFLLRGEDLREAEEWQADAATKEPKPTTLHSQYILASRQGETRRQRLTLGSALVALILTIALAIVALTQRNTARKETAIARARQLAAQAELVRETSPEASALLGVESDNFAPLAENVSVLHRTLPLLRKGVAVLSHHEPVHAVSFSPDSRFLATGSERGARIFSVPSGKEIARYPSGDIVTSVAFSPDGQYLAMGSWDGAARIINGASGQQSILKHKWRVEAVAFSPNGHYLATSDWSGNAFVFEVPGGRAIAHVRHKASIVHLAWDPTSRYLATAGSDNQATVTDVKAGSVVRRLMNEGGISTVAFSPNGHYIATGSSDARARVFEARTGRLLLKLQLENEINALKFSPDGNYLCLGANDNSVRVYTFPTGREVSRLQHRLGVNAVAWSPDGQYAASASFDGTALLFEAHTGKILARIEHPEQPGTETGITDVVFSPNGRYLATASFDGTARISRVVDETSQVMDLQHQGKLLSVALDAHGKYLATGNWDDVVIISDLAKGTQTSQFKMGGAIYGLDFSRDSRFVAATENSSPGVVQISNVNGSKPPLTLNLKSESRVVAFSPDERYLAAESEENMVHTFSLQDGKQATGFAHEVEPNSSDEVYAAAFSPDGKYLLTSRSDGFVRLFDAKTAKVLTRLKLERIPIAVAFSEDSQYVIARLSDNTGLVFQPLQNKVLTRLQASGGVLAVAFSPDGQFVAAGGSDHSAQVFEVSHWSPVARVECGGPVRAVAFSEDGKYLVSAALENEGSEDITVTVQRTFWKHQDLRNEACSRLNRNLTHNEWQQYFPGEAYRRSCPDLP